MAGYAYVSSIQDPAAQRAMIAALDQIQVLMSRVATLEAQALRNAAAMDANAQRITAVADPTGAQDAVTLSYLRSYVAAQLETFKT